jgi:hypothetical protein
MSYRPSVAVLEIAIAPVKQTEYIIQREIDMGPITNLYAAGRCSLIITHGKQH